MTHSCAVRGSSLRLRAYVLLRAYCVRALGMPRLLRRESARALVQPCYVLTAERGPRESGATVHRLHMDMRHISARMSRREMYVCTLICPLICPLVSVHTLKTNGVEPARARGRIARAGLVEGYSTRIRYDTRRRRQLNDPRIYLGPHATTPPSHDLPPTRPELRLSIHATMPSCPSTLTPPRPHESRE